MTEEKFTEIRPKLIEFIRQEKIVTPHRVKTQFNLNWITAEKFLNALKKDKIAWEEVMHSGKKTFKFWRLRKDFLHADP